MIFRQDSLPNQGAHGGIHSRDAWQPIRMQDSYSGRLKDHRFSRFASGPVCSAIQYVAVFSAARQASISHRRTIKACSVGCRHRDGLAFFRDGEISWEAVQL